MALKLSGNLREVKPESMKGFSERPAHTPGPWIADEWIDTGKYGVTTADRSYRVAVSMDKDDARLIAAAPELLSALEKLVRVIDRMPANAADGIADEARAAIAKAKGETC